jgi:Fe-S oxidoreductase
MKKDEEANYKYFDADKCRLCGECLSRCPVLALPRERAKEEKKKLNEGRPSAWVLRKCTGCFNCDDYCPNNANPCEQIVYHWYREYQELGLKPRAKYFLTHQPQNFRTYVMDRMPADEKALVAAWNDTSPCEEIVYPGCNATTIAYLTQTSLLKDYTIRGGLDFCCGETFFRMGYYDRVGEIARRHQRVFGEMGLKRMLIMCTAGANMFTNILPRRFGARFDFEVTPLLRWLWEGLESGRIEIKQPLAGTVTIQDSCYSKFFGKDYLELPRKILSRLGLEVREMKTSCGDMRCCGIGGGFSIQSAFLAWDILGSAAAQLRAARQTGADILATYCAGCSLMLSAGKFVYPSPQPVYHVLELVQLAMGEKPLHRIRSRAFTMLIGCLRHQLPSYLATGRFRPELYFPET